MRFTRGSGRCLRPERNAKVITIPLIQKITELFLILFATAALVKTGVFKADYSKVLSRISLYFVTPCVIFNSFQKELTPEIQQGLLMTTALAFGFQLLFFLFAAILRRVWKATDVEQASVVFTNAGNLIIPLVGYVLGEEWVIYVSGYILVYNVLFWTVGIRMFDRQNALSIKKVLLNPNILAVLAGLVSLFTGLHLPEAVSIAFADVASMIGPLAMMITGMIVGGMKFRDMFANRRVFGIILFRMVIASGIAAVAAALSGIAGGMSRDLAAAYDVMAGKYGNGEERKQKLAAAGYDYWTVQNLVNGLAKGYDKVARDVINGRYGNDQYRINSLRAAGYDPALVQAIVNGMLA